MLQRVYELQPAYGEPNEILHGFGNNYWIFTLLNFISLNTTNKGEIAS